MNKSFCDVFRELRLEKKLSQEAIAKELDVSQSLINNWETNRSTPAPEMLEYIADYFDVSVDYLIGRSNFKNLEANSEIDKALFSKARQLDNSTKIALLQVMNSVHKDIDKELDK